MFVALRLVTVMVVCVGGGFGFVMDNSWNLLISSRKARLERLWSSAALEFFSHLEEGMQADEEGQHQWPACA